MLLALGGVCAAVPYDSLLYQPVHKVSYVCYPVTAAWQAAFSMFGVEGDSGMRFIPLMLVSVALYLGAMGYALGALLGKFTKHQ